MANQVQFEPWSHLDEKIVLVTGASSGLGREFCLDLAKAGCKVVAAARRTDRLKSLCDEINKLASSSSIRAVALELDVKADACAIGMSIQRAWNAFGYIDSLINNAGVRGMKVVSCLNLQPCHTSCEKDE